MRVIDAIVSIFISLLFQLTSVLVLEAKKEEEKKPHNSLHWTRCENRQNEFVNFYVNNTKMPASLLCCVDIDARNSIRFEMSVELTYERRRFIFLFFWIGGVKKKCSLYILFNNTVRQSICIQAVRSFFFLSRCQLADNTKLINTYICLANFNLLCNDNIAAIFSNGNSHVSSF